MTAANTLTQRELELARALCVIRLTSHGEEISAVHLQMIRCMNQEETKMYQPYDKETASTTDRIAWAFCQISDDDAPMRWARYRFAAECIAKNPELMADLKALSEL